MNTKNTTRRKRRWLIGIPAGIVLLIVVIFAAIPPLVMNDMVNLHVTFAQTWTGEEQGTVFYIESQNERRIHES